MNSTIDLGNILSPISGESPAGEDLRYTTVYDEIREARRADDAAPQGEWEREVKNSDWSKVVSTSLAALSRRSKDLQIAAWLTEALAMTQGFQGVETGLNLLAGLLGNFWEEIFPRIEDDDYDYRVAPFEFLNEKLSASVRQIPMTDPRVTPGFSYLKWQESREIGYEADAKGDKRKEMLAEGKVPAEEVDIAVSKSTAAFYQSLADSIARCLESFRILDLAVDRKYGRHAPRLSDLGRALEDCSRLVLKICRELKGIKGVKDAMDSAPAVPVGGPGFETSTGLHMEAGAAPVAGALNPALLAGAPDSAVTTAFPGNAGPEAQETWLWNEALRVMQGDGFKEALNLLLAAASSQSSERGRSRYRFLVAKLCLKAGRPDLARPIVEQLNTMINELQLEKWECPFWISGIYRVLHQCLLAGEGADEESSRASELLKKICTMDVTKALDSKI
jgi:type VI secretion system protein ImpA